MANRQKNYNNTGVPQNGTLHRAEWPPVKHERRKRILESVAISRVRDTADLHRTATLWRLCPMRDIQTDSDEESSNETHCCTSSTQKLEHVNLLPPLCPRALVIPRQLSHAWARRVVLAVGEREARLQAAERFRDANKPRFVCPECHEFGCSSADSLNYHLLDTSWHATHASLQVWWSGRRSGT